MTQRGFFLLAVVLCVATHAMAQPTRDRQGNRIADKLWWIIDITKQYQPQFQAHVTLEAPDGERLALTLQGESARTLVHDDVITLARKSDIPADLPEHAMGGYFIPSFEFIPLKSSIATGSGAPGSCAAHSRPPSPDRGRPASTGGSGL